MRKHEEATPKTTPGRQQHTPGGGTGVGSRRLSVLRPQLALSTAHLTPYSPGAAATPQLFVQRRGLFADVGSSADGASPAGAQDDRIKVVARIRPAGPGREAAEPPCLQHTGADTLTLLTAEPSYHTLDHVLGASASQHQVFKVIGRPLVETVIGGYNATVIAYGQTGSGKTFTMLGELPAEGACEGTELPAGGGLIPRIYHHLFARMRELQGGQARPGRSVSFSLSCALLEIYKEQVTDLLAPSSAGAVALREDKREGVFAEGLSWHAVDSTAAVLRLLARGAASRHTAATKTNDVSSRSHMVMQCAVESKVVEEGTACVVTRRSKLVLVDLAGSERQKAADTEGDRLREAQAINLSLFTLGQVIHRLTAEGGGGGGHVPYRESKLTLLLRESLGGNSRTVIIPTVSPAASCLPETQSTLQFATRAKQVRCAAVVNEGVSQSAADMQAELQRLRGEVAVLRRAVAGSGDGGGKGTDDSGGKGSSGAEGTLAGADLAAALGVNAELEAQLAAVQEQMGRLRRERDAHEAAAAAAHAQQQILEEAEGAAEARAAGLAAECQRLQVACAERESEAETLQGRLAGLEASEAAARERLEAAAGAAAQQATALEQAEGELEVARGQLRARSASRSSGKGKENRQGSAEELLDKIGGLEAMVQALQGHQQRIMAANDALLEEKHQLRAQVADLEVRAANAAVVMEAGRSQVEGLRGERAQLAGEAARLGDALADAEARLQALARRNGELSLEVDNHRSSALPDQLAAAQREAAQLRDALEERGAEAGRLEALEAALEEHQAAEAGLRAQLAQAREERLALEAVAAYERKHRQLAQRDHQVQTEAAPGESEGEPPVDASEVAALRLQLGEARAAAAAAAEQLAAREALVRELRAEAKEAAEGMQQLQATMTDVQAKVEADQQERERAEQELAAQDQLAAEAQDLSRRLQQALSAAQASAAEREQLQEILDVKGDRLAALEAEGAVREARLAELDAQLAVLATQEADATAAAEAAAADAAAARGEARSLALQLEEAQDALAAARQQAADREVELAALQTRLDVATAAAAARDGDAAELAAAAACAAEELACLRREASSQHTAASEAQAAVAELQARLTAAVEEAAQQRVATADADAALASLQARLSAAEDEAAEANESLAAAQQQLVRTQQQLADAEQGLAVRTEQLQAHEAALAAAQQAAAAQAAALDTERAATKAGALRGNGLEARLAQLSKELAAAQDKARQYDEACLDLERQLSAAEAAVARLQGLDGELAAAREQLAEGARELEAKEWRIQDLSHAAADLREEALRAAAEAEAATASAAELRSQLDAQAAEAAAAADRLTAERDAAAAEAAAARDRAGELEVALAAARQQVEESAAALVGIGSEVEALKERQQSQGSASQERTAELEQQLEQAGARATAAEAAVEEQRQAAAAAEAKLAEAVQQQVATLRAVQDEVAVLKAEAAKAQREQRVLRESLNQATTDSTDHWAALQERGQELGALRAQVAHLQRQLEEGAVTQSRVAAAAAQHTSALAALQAERDRLLEDQQRLVQALAEQQAALAEAAGAVPGGAAPSPLPAPSPAPPSLDVLRVLRDQKEALRAQHEATVADMKEREAAEAALTAGQLAAVRRQRDAALADLSFAREEARAAAAAQEAALATARQAQEQLQTDRDAVMGSLTELQAAFNAAEAKRGAELRRLRAVADAKTREASALRAALEQRAADKRRLTLQQQPGGQQAAAAEAAQPASQRGYADMEADLVLQRSMASSLGGSAAGLPGGARASGVVPLQLQALSAHSDVVQPLTARSAGAQPHSAGSKVLQPISLAAHDNVAATPLGSPPKQQQQQVRASGEGWCTGYLKKFSDDGALQPVSTGKRQRGILGARFLVTPHDENSRGGTPLRVNVARYGRLEDEQQG